MTSFGGEPRAFAISLNRFLGVTPRWPRATECSQPRTPSERASSSGSGGTPRSASVLSTKSRCVCGISLLMSTDVPSVGTLAGITMSTPYGLPSVFSSIHGSTVSRSSASLNRTQPSMPSPPARLTAAATFSDGVKTKIGYWMPNLSQSSVLIASPLASLVPSRRRPSMLGMHVVCRPLLRRVLRPAVVGLTRRRSLDLVHQPKAAWHFVSRDLLADEGVEVRQCRPRAVACVHHRGDVLTEAGIGHADHQRVEHVGVTLQRGLHLFGVDLLAAAVDGDRAPAQHRDGAVGLDLGEVARDRVPHTL